MSYSILYNFLFLLEPNTFVFERLMFFFYRGCVRMNSFREHKDNHLHY